jgi:hypothetical protein
VDRARHKFDDWVEKLPCVLRVLTCDQAGRVRNVGEKDRYLFSLAFRISSGRYVMFGDVSETMARGVRAKRKIGATDITEGIVWLRVKVGSRILSGEPYTAPSAEICRVAITRLAPGTFHDPSGPSRIAHNTASHHSMVRYR